MNRSCPRITLQDLRDQRFAGAPAGWIHYLERLISERLVDEASVATWLPAGEILSGVLAKRARALRGRGPFRQQVWSPGEEKFIVADPSDVNRLEEPGALTPLDLCEHCRLVPASRDLVDEYVGWIRTLFVAPEEPGRLCGDDLSSGRIASAIATAVREAAEVADNHWKALWASPERTGAGAAARSEIESGIRDHLTKSLRQPDRCCITKTAAATPSDDGLVFLIEGLGGERNFDRRISFYAISVAAAWLTGSGSDEVRFNPICAAVYVPSVRHLYMGVAGKGGGAALVDEQFSTVHKLSGSAAKTARGGRLTVGIHHSRKDILLSHEFVDLVSRLLPPYVDKEIAMGAGPWSLVMTASGSLAGFFESSISCVSAYPGAIILCAATGRPESATDLAGRSWIEGNPLLKKGVLAWSNENLRRDIRQAVEAGCVRFCAPLSPGALHASTDSHCST